MVVANQVNQFELVETPYANRLKKLLKITLIVVFVLVVILFILAALFGFSSSKSKICTSRSCIAAANMILENMNASVDPCEDFYQFTCGGYIKNTRLHEDQYAINTFAELDAKLGFAVSDLLSERISNEKDIAAVKSAKKLFKSCTNEDIIETSGEIKLIRFLNEELGGWPMLNEQYFNPSLNSTLRNLITLHQIGTYPLFYFYASSNPKDPNYFVLRVSQASWFMLKEYYEDDFIAKAYKAFIIKTARFLNSTNRDLVNEVNRMFELEKKIAMNLYTREKMRRTKYMNTTFGELQRNINDFKWKEFSDGVFRKNNVNEYINDNEIIIVDHLDYFTNMSRIFSNALIFQKRDLDNLLIWSFVRNSIDFLPRKYSEALTDLRKAYVGSSRVRERAALCSDFVTESMEYAVGRMYVQNYFDSNSKEIAVDMILNIQKEFITILGETNWLDQKSLKAALEKANSIDVKIGYPEFTYNDTYLNEIYEQYIFSENELLQNYLTMNKAETVKMFKIFRKKRDRKQWFTGPAVVNAYYSPSSNQICFPAGILQRPFYDSKFPKYLNYGGIGAVIGHEITHGFDDNGRKYDKDGIFHEDGDGSLWTNATIENYKSRAQCVIDQYSNYLVKEINKTLNGKQTLGENIADNGGIKESYRAYMKWLNENGPEPSLPGLDYSAEQLFFINYGQIWCGKYREQYLRRAVLGGVHSLGEFRVIGTSSNSEAFSAAFKCKSGQKNNPEKKCSVW